MLIHTLGTSAGTQPFPGHHHTSIAIETESGLYFLDAGECCGYTAHINNIDLLKTKAVFISHPHMDHVGGLGNLLWYIRKLTYVRKEPLQSDNIDIFTPCRATVDGFMQVLENTEGNFSCSYTHAVHDVAEGVIFDNGDIKVSAVPTHHLPAKEDGTPASFAFRIECEGKTVVFSGDMRLEDAADIVPGHADVFMVETGHHQIEDICRVLSESGKDIKKLIFVHHGGYIMRDPEGAKSRAEAAFGNAFISHDGQTFEI